MLFRSFKALIPELQEAADIKDINHFCHVASFPKTREWALFSVFGIIVKIPYDAMERNEQEREELKRDVYTCVYEHHAPKLIENAFSRRGVYSVTDSFWWLFACFWIYTAFRYGFKGFLFGIVVTSILGIIIGLVVQTKGCFM